MGTLALGGLGLADVLRGRAAAGESHRDTSVIMLYLIEDVFERGLDRRVLVVVMGEFGRTPRLSRNATGVGRDHWPQAYSALIFGGGLQMGQVIGATNAKAEYPTVRPYSPQDLLATIYQHLGIDPNRQFVDFMGRPVAILPHGSPIRELL